jgi:hypothetical protein
MGMTNDALHVHSSLIIMFVSALLLRRRADSIICWLTVLVAELFNEYADLRGQAPGEATLDASLNDVYMTMFWPTIIVLSGWLLFPRKIREKPGPEPASSDLADKPFEQAPTV